MMEWLGKYILNLESVLVGKVSHPIAFFHVYSFFPLCGFMYLCVHSETRRGSLESFSISLHHILETGLSLNLRLVSVRLIGQ